MFCAECYHGKHLSGILWFLYKLAKEPTDYEKDYWEGLFHIILRLDFFSMVVHIFLTWICLNLTSILIVIWVAVDERKSRGNIPKTLWARLFTQTRASSLRPLSLLFIFFPFLFPPSRFFLFNNPRTNANSGPVSGRKKRGKNANARVFTKRRRFS